MIIILILLISFLAVLVFLCNSGKNESFSEDCTRTLIQCKTDNDCNGCPANFTCREVSEDDNYVFNNVKVPPGNFCIPPDDPEDCNRYSGRWIWSSEGNQQKWKCECIYPALFGNNADITNCTAKFACTNPNFTDSDDRLKGNRIVGTKYAPENLRGKLWDPEYGDSEVLMVNPYTVDEYGNPFFSCKCDSKSINKAMTSLPSSPYLCHVDQCFPDNETDGIVIGPTGIISCDCSKGGGNMEKVPEGDKKGLCFDIKVSCGDENTWDNDTNMCKCIEGSFSEKCTNNYGVKGDIDRNGNEFKCPTNVAGRICVNPCEPDPCKNDSICSTKTTNGGKPDYHCKCKSGFKDKNCQTPCKESGKEAGICNSYSTPPYGTINYYCVYNSECCGDIDDTACVDHGGKCVCK